MSERDSHRSHLLVRGMRHVTEHYCRDHHSPGRSLPLLQLPQEDQNQVVRLWLRRLELRFLVWLQGNRPARVPLPRQEIGQDVFCPALSRICPQYPCQGPRHCEPGLESLAALVHVPAYGAGEKEACSDMQALARGESGHECQTEKAEHEGVFLAHGLSDHSCGGNGRNCCCCHGTLPCPNHGQGRVLEGHGYRVENGHRKIETRFQNLWIFLIGANYNSQKMNCIDTVLY